MKFGFDVHGVLDTRPAQLKPIMRALVAMKHEVHIITGCPYNDYMKELLYELNIVKGTHYTHYFSIEEDMKKRKVEKNEKGLWDDYEWNICKAKYCKEKNIALMVDDSEDYELHFRTPFARFNP